jgi:uncharacterized protein
MIGTVVIKAIKACNLRCPYCYYINDDTPGYGQVISHQTVERLYAHLAEYLQEDQEVMLVWHGGEPLMLGQRRFGDFLNMQTDFHLSGRVRNVVQTNGTMVNASWISFLQQHNVGVGISIDGSRAAHDKNRRTTHGRPTYNRVVRAITDFKRSGSDVGVLSVIDSDFSGAEAIRNIRALGVQAYDLLLPISNNALQQAGLGGEYSAYTDVPKVARFLTEAFNEWLHDSDLDIRLFRAIMRNAVGLQTGYPYAGANNVGDFVVLEPDGTIALDPDFWHIDRFALGSYYYLHANVHDESFSLTTLDANLQAFVAANGLDRLPDDCQDCVVRSLCRGSHPASRFGSDGSFNHRSVYCQAMYELCIEALNYLIDRGLETHLIDPDLRRFIAKRRAKERAETREASLQPVDQ